ncbi:DNA-processing protein DprA [Trueperella pyogenes]|uniref:DNA-processing protein DprA n=1 Tax=Trueperella pyogenes TaxID=1661 RepID=UPI00345CFED9
MSPTRKANTKMLQLVAPIQVPAQVEQLSDYGISRIQGRGNINLLNRKIATFLTGACNELLEQAAKELTSGHKILGRHGREDRLLCAVEDLFQPTITVSASGLDYYHGRGWEKRKQQIISRDGAIITCTQNMRPPSRQAFIWRNQLIVALSHMVILASQPHQRTGAQAIAKLALAKNRPVILITPENQELTSADHELLTRGAKLAYTPQEVDQLAEQFS